MNKFTRFTLFAGLMAFGLAACGDDVQVVDPPPPPPDPLVVSLQPGDVAIEVGETVNLAVNISGGEAGAATTIVCSASNSSVSVTTNAGGATCAVTGVTEGGNATVTVVVTRGDQTATAGAGVEVLEDTSVPATIVIEKVTQGSLLTPVALNNVQRQIEVTVNIDPGTQVLDVVTLFFRGQEIASQDLSPAQVAAMRGDSPEAQVLRVITFSWETDSYLIDAGGGPITGAATAIPNHLNGLGALLAQVTVDDGSDTGSAVNSVPLDLTLRNLNGFHLKIDRTGSTNTALDVQLFEWRGGRDSSGTVNAGIDAHLIPVLYTPGVTLASAQFVFAAGAALRVLTAAPWTYVWTPASLGGYTMPVGGTAAFPNMLRDGEYPSIAGGAVLSDGQGMGPFGGALDCTGGIGVPGAPIGILNIEVSATLLCAGGTNWSPPSASLVVAANQVLDVLRAGERIDNAPPFGQTFTLSSRPGLPDWPQLPAAPATGALVASAGTWVNENIDFSGGGIHATGGMIDIGVSRAVAGFPAPVFLAPTFWARGGALGGTYIEITADPTGMSLPETITNNVYNVQVVDADELDNRATLTLAGATGSVLLGSDWVDPFLQHTSPFSNPDRDAFDLATLWAGSGAAGDDLTVSDYNYFVNWTDPINVGASGFTAFAGNPVWRHIHRIAPGGLVAVVTGSGGNTGVTPSWSTATGLRNYGRTGASLQAVTGLSVVNGYYIYRAYVLDDAGNASRDVNCTGACAQPQAGTVTYESAAVRRQAVVDGPAAAGQPTVFGVTAPVLMTGGTTVNFISNSSDNLDLGQSFLSLDYATFTAVPLFWTTSSSAAGPNALGGYWSPVATLAPIQGTTGGVRHLGANNEEGVIFDSPFEAVASLVTAAALSRDVPGFIRSIEWVCDSAGLPFASCPAAPADWVSDIAVNLNNGAAGAVGWFSPASVSADAAYAANRPNLASFSQFDATRFDHVPATSGNVNYNLEQVAPDNAGSLFPHRSVSTAPINPVSVPLNAPGGVVTSVYHDGGLQVGWAMHSATASIGGTSVTARPVGPAPAVGGGRVLTVSATARLITGSTIVAGGPGQNLFPGPLGRVDFYVLEPATGTLRYLGMQNNPIVFENNPACVTNTMATQASYRCWDFQVSGTIANFVGGVEPVQILAIGVNAAGDGLATFPIDAL